MARLLTFEEVKAFIGERARGSNKGSHGRGLILAGSDGLSGAAVMASASALRAGIGTLKALVPKSVLPAFYALPEAMATGLEGAWEAPDEATLFDFLGDCTCAAVGSGMGRGAGVLSTVNAILATGKPAVIDADGLNALSRAAGFSELLHENAILTPHPGEMARLTGKQIAEITENPEEIALSYAKLWGCTVLLKGAASHIAAPDGRVRRNETGNAGLAKGGSGDVLAGIALSFLGQSLKPFEAACAAAYVLGAAADEAMELLKERMLLSRDVTEAVKKTVERLF
ncbi:MAG: NAD(P)H-hydrate dehydratase [Eubacteriales bacterium]|nr:NAD(P)H-hydrate dehydratase [Eubacteriales bacterium]